MIFNRREVNILGERILVTDINLLVVYISYDIKMGWARLFGSWYGIHWKMANEPHTFSERYGYIKTVRIGKYKLRILKPI